MKTKILTLVVYICSTGVFLLSLLETHWGHSTPEFRDEGVELAGHGLQSPLDALGIARYDGEVGFCRLVRFGTALFPVP